MMGSWRKDKQENILRYLKYAAVVLIILAILAAVIFFQRDSIVRKFANSALSGQDITMTELSIQTLGTDHVRLSHLVLEHRDGTRYQISGLSIPLSFPSIRAEKISIEQLIVITDDIEAAPAPLASLLQNFLQLPDNVPNTEVTVSGFSMPEAPPIENIVWRSVDQRQHLAFSIDPVEVTVDVDSADNGDYQLTVNATVSGIPDALSLPLTVHRSDTGFSIDGVSTISLSPWLPVLKATGILPAEIVSLGAKLGGPIMVVLDDDPLRSVPASARLSLAGEMTAEYRSADFSAVRLRVNSSDPIRFSIEYPSLEWNVSVRRSDLVVGSDTIDDVPVRINDLECRSGIHCTVRAFLDSGPIELEGMTVGSAKLSASLDIAIDETTRLEISPDMVLALTGVESQDFSVASINATQFSGAQLSIDDNGWRSDIDRLTLMIDSLTDQESLLTTLPVTFSKLRLRDSGSAIVSEFSIAPKTASVSWDGTGIVTPAVAGKISLQDDKVAASVSLSDGDGALSAQVDASHSLLSGKGSISVRDAEMHFDQGKLSSRFLKWPNNWDIVSGTWTTDLDLEWETSDAGTQYSGTMTHLSDALAGNHRDIVFTGLNTRLTASLDSADGITFSPSSIEVAMLDVGVPIERIAADLVLNAGEQAVQVQSLSMSTLGGQLVTDPFRFSMQAEQNDITLRPQSVQLQFMIDLVEFEDIKLSGSISGVLPVTIKDNTLTITNGRLESDPPGGVIRYRPGTSEGAEVSDSGLGLVTQALSNFQFESLTSDVNYMENGDLKLQMQLTGINPDIDDKQPVILNLGVENNIPQLLRSLQATRSVMEILEKSSAR